MLKPSRLAILISMALPFAASAQSLQGQITHPDGKPIGGAIVEIKAKNITVTADASGQFSIQDIPAGQYEFHVYAPGFAHLHQKVSVVDAISRQQFQLQRSSIEVIDVVATPMHMSTMESASPVSVLAGDALRREQSATLGDTLEKLPGVQSNFHGNVASTPIIRGLSGPRVQIAQNGLDVSDVSRVGPDHSVAGEASTAQQIEVLRGPATLFYGSGAIGGVVNIVDNRIPTNSDTRGEWLLETDSVNDQRLGSFNVTSGTENIAVYADGYWRESNDYKTPVAADADDPQGEHFVANSGEESNGFTLGASYLMDDGYVGVAVEQFNREYGIPGHTHGGDEHDHDDAAEHVYADLDQTKIQLIGEYNVNGDWLERLLFRAGHTKYEHAEIEHGAVGTVFKNKTDELRLDFLHAAFADWQGGISFHYKKSDVAAQGDEAFTPPSEFEMQALALMEERRFGDVLLQLGARVERVTLDANTVKLPSLAAHSHDEGHDDHDHDHGEALTRVFDVSQKFTPISLSAGLVWDFTPGYNLGIAVSRSQRAPSASELLSFGPHIGTGSYEVGALFGLTGEEEPAIGLSDTDIALETANNIDLTLRKTEGDVGFVINAFYNQVDNYYYQIDTGLYAESGHHHGDEGGEEHADHDHAAELPVYLFQMADATLHGFEAQISWQVTDDFKASVFSDYVRARLQNGGGDLPYTPPLRYGSRFSYLHEGFAADLDITRYGKQDRIAAYETPTDGYTLVDASVSYSTYVLAQDITFYLKGSNLTNEAARVHSSFLKNIAPRPGRSIAVGLRGSF
ncbi:TonB-dependent receptor [Shewanella sp. YIC-542]|uniref:TonB-dependent receptor n=1 Tax=Shewanella mytili TaxID=3377111 RepID=UPI00398E57CD